MRGLLPVHVLHLHDAELPAERLVGVRQQLEREIHLGFETTRGDLSESREMPYTSQLAFLKSLWAPAKSAPRWCIPGCCPWVEVQDELAAARVRKPEGGTAGGRKAEV